MSEERKKKPENEGLMELIGLETSEEVAQVKKLANDAWLVGRLTWEQTLGLAPVKGLDP